MTPHEEECKIRARAIWLWAHADRHKGFYSTQDEKRGYYEAAQRREK